MVLSCIDDVLALPVDLPTLQRCPEEEIVCEAPFRFEPDMNVEGRTAELTSDQVKDLILNEIAAYHPALVQRVVSMK